MTEPISYPTGMRHPEHSGLRLLWTKSSRIQVLWKWVTELQKPWLCQSHQCGFQVLVTRSEMQETQQCSLQHPRQWSRAMVLGRKHLCSNSRKYRQKMDREIQTTPVSSLFTPGWGEQTIPVLHHNCYHFGKEMQAGNANHKYPLTSSTLHFLHSTWHPSILPHPSSPGPTSIFLNSTSDLLESKCIPSDAPRIQGCRLPAPSFTPDYTWTTSLRLLHSLVPKEEDCVLKAVY